jgi:hypothetical protein
LEIKISHPGKDGTPKRSSLDILLSCHKVNAVEQVFLRWQRNFETDARTIHDALEEMKPDDLLEPV